LKSIKYILAIYIIVTLVACSGTKGLKPDDKLFSGTKVTYIDKQNVTKKSNVKRAVTANLLKANSPGFFNVKTGFYNWYEKTGKKGFKHAIKYRMGSQPVVFEPQKISITEKRIKKAMVDDGYLQAKVSCDSLENNNKIELECNATLGQRYVIDSVFYLQDTLPICKTLIVLHQLEYTKSGDYYQLKNLVSDRDELVAVGKNNGFPFINQQDVIYFVDTLVGDNKVDIHMRLRSTEDSLKYERYRYGGIYINPNFSLDTDNPTDTTHMNAYEEYNMVKGYDFLREDALNKAMFIKEGTIYDAKRSKLTTDRLLDFGLFKFVNVKTKVNPQTNRIDHFLNLTTYKMESITGELELNNRQGNFLGLLGKVTYSNKNMFGGAEKFDLSFSGGLETQFGDKQSFINTSDIKLEAGLTIPTVVLPFFSFQTNRNFIPKTTISLSVNQTQRVEFYTVRSASAKYGFKWNETDVKSSFFRPVDLSWLVLSNTTPEFDVELANDRRLALSFQNTLISGSSYDFVYNKRDKFDPANQLYFKGSIESAGNLLSLFLKPNAGQTQADLFGTSFAQYTKLTADVRKYWSLGNSGSIASKLIVGAGFAYGNSDELPYSKQFSVGGANSIRSFRLRTLGPGEFQSPSADNQFIDQTGDIKIESSVEYRFPIIGFFKGALFLDAGNVWLYDSDDTLKQNGVFSFDSFLNQVAVGTGLGLRIDIDFLVLRLDAAFPLRNIQADGKFGWVIKDIKPFSGSWHGRNMVFNLGIGYPF
jgi:outer membrane protein insertion porin family